VRVELRQELRRQGVRFTVTIHEGRGGWCSYGGSLTITPWRLGIAESNPQQSAVHTITVIPGDEIEGIWHLS